MSSPREDEYLELNYAFVIGGYFNNYLLDSEN